MILGINWYKEFPIIHIKIKDDDLSFFRDFYHFPNCQ